MLSTIIDIPVSDYDSTASCIFLPPCRCIREFKSDAANYPRGKKYEYLI